MIRGDISISPGAGASQSTQPSSLSSWKWGFIHLTLCPTHVGCIPRALAKAPWLRLLFGRWVYRFLLLFSGDHQLDTSLCLIGCKHCSDSAVGGWADVSTTKMRYFLEFLGLEGAMFSHRRNVYPAWDRRVDPWVDSQGRPAIFVQGAEELHRACYAKFEIGRDWPKNDEYKSR